MSAVDEELLAAAHRLSRERGWGARRIGQELGISRYAAGQLLARPLADRPAEAADQVAEPVAVRWPTPVGHLEAGQRLVVDLGDRSELAADLRLLRESTGTRTDADVVDYAIATLAAAYRQALASGLLRPGQPLRIADISLRPGTVRAA